MKNKNKILKEVLDMVHNGGSISNYKLNIAIKELTPLVDTLFDLGPHYYLTWKELHCDLLLLNSFKIARERK
jgi:hypothetical protein